MSFKRQILFFVLCVGLIGSSVNVTAMSRGIHQNKVHLEKFLPKGYVKDGSVDYTNVIQKVLNEHNSVVFPDFPLLVNDAGLKVKSNSVLEFQENSLIKLKGTNKDTYNIIEIHEVENVKILNPKIKGDRETHIGKGGEHGMGIAIRSAKNITITNAKIEDCWGDGIYLGRIRQKYDRSGMFVPPENIRIEGAYLIRNRRNAVSVTAGKDVLLKDIQAINTKGTAPMAGIDIEPNANKDYLEGIVLENIFTKNNRYGIQLCLKKMVGTRDAHVDVIIRNHVDEKSTIAFRIDKFDREGKQLQGKIEVVNAEWKDNQRGHLSFAGSQHQSCTIVFQGVQGKVKQQSVSIRNNFALENTSRSIRSSVEKNIVFR